MLHSIVHYSRSILVLFAVAPALLAEAPPATCGNGLLEIGESCQTCEADCKPQPCSPQGRFRASVSVVSPEASPASAATLNISYRSNRLSIPGTGQDKSATERINFGDSSSGITAFKDFDYSIRLVRAEGSTLPRPMVTIDFDGCAGAAKPTESDLVCVVEGCAGKGGAIADACTCGIAMEPVSTSKRPVQNNKTSGTTQIGASSE